MVTVVFRQPAFNNYKNSPSGDIGRYLAKKGILILGASKRQVGVNTGALRASIHMRHFRDTRGQYVRIGSSLPYARLHHEGTKPHLIRPNNKQVLKFMTRGQLVITHLVRHPGTKPNRYLSDNLRLVK
jgi:hypothetical protein